MTTNKIDYLNLKEINAPWQEEMEEAVHRVIDSGWYLQGEANKRFSEAYAQYIGTRHCITCGNGLDALRLMLLAAIETGRLHEGDSVIVPANTYIATILAITECKLYPILVEPRRDTLQIDDARLKEALTPTTRAVMLVHLYGRCSMTEGVERFCREHQLLLFEDNAQAHGCQWQGRKTGSLGLAAAHSFYPGKNLGALGDAGAVTTDDDKMAEVIKALGNYGSSRKYVFPYRGYNSRMDEVQAAVLKVKLRHLDEVNRRRWQCAQWLLDAIKTDKVYVPREMYNDSSLNVVHIFPVLCPERDRLQQHLREHGIGTMIHYPIPPHKQECYREWREMELPVTEAISREELSLPCHQMLTEQQANVIADAVNMF